MTARRDDGFQVWLDTWKAWQDANRTNFSTWTAGAQGLNAAGLCGPAEQYQAFADSVMQLAVETGGGDLSKQLAQAIDRIRDLQPGDECERMLRAFLFAVPAAPFVDATLGHDAEGPEQVTDSLLDRMSAWLDMPTVGPHREWTDAFKRAQQALLAQQHAALKLKKRYHDAAMLALDHFATFLNDESGAPITSIKGLYDAWIDIAESAYTEAVMDAGFATDFAAWINTGSDTRLKFRALFEPLAVIVDMPQRGEFDTLLERQYELMREVETLRTELAEIRAKTSPRSRSKGSSTPTP